MCRLKTSNSLSGPNGRILKATFMLASASTSTFQILGQSVVCLTQHQWVIVQPNIFSVVLPITCLLVQSDWTWQSTRPVELPPKLIVPEMCLCAYTCCLCLSIYFEHQKLLPHYPNCTIKFRYLRQNETLLAIEKRVRIKPVQ